LASAGQRYPENIHMASGERAEMHFAKIDLFLVISEVFRIVILVDNI
jgi:hypothetical protein